MQTIKYQYYIDFYKKYNYTIISAIYKIYTMSDINNSQVPEQENVGISSIIQNLSVIKRQDLEQTDENDLNKVDIQKIEQVVKKQIKSQENNAKDVQVQNIDVKQEDDLQNDLNNAVLDGVNIEENPENQAVLDDVRIAQNNKDNQLSKDQDKQENNGHYEERDGHALLWGLLICSCVLLGPLGGGFAFLFTPIQLSSMLLIPFYKKGKRKVFVADKDSNPQDKLVSAKEGVDRGIFKDVKGSEVLKEVVNEKAFANEILKNNKLAQYYKNLSEKEPNILKELPVFSTLVSSFGGNNIQNKITDILSHENNNIANSLVDTTFMNQINKLHAAKTEADKEKVAQDIVDYTNTIVNTIPELKGTIDISKKNEFAKELVKHENDIMQKIECYNSFSKETKDKPLGKTNSNIQDASNAVQLSKRKQDSQTLGRQ